MRLSDSDSWGASIGALLVGYFWSAPSEGKRRRRRKKEEEGWNTGKGAGRVPRIGKGKGNVRLGEEGA